MKLNIANPSSGTMKVFDIDDEKKLVHLYDKRMGQEIDGDVLGDEFKGYVFKISGGNDKQGFPMMQGVLMNQRVRLLMQKGSTYYRPRRTGERKRKSVRGCIVGPDLAILNLVIVKPGETIVGLTDPASARDRRLGPKRASKIRKLFNLSKEDDVRKKVICRTFTTRKGKVVHKRPKIQRLVTPLRLQRKRSMLAAKRKAAEKARTDRAEYERLKAQRSKERRDSKHSKRRSSRKNSNKAAATSA